MRRVSFIVAAILAIGTASAEAQSPVLGPYAEFTTGVAGSSALLGGEVGVSRSSWDFFFEFGRMLNTRPSEMETAANLIATALGSGVTAEAKQPVTYFDVGARYKFPTSGRIHPYAGLAIGGAKVSRNVSFALNGNDITDQLPAMGVQLGGDLSGSEGGALFMLGGGAEIPLQSRFFLDVSYRYAHVWAGDGVNTNRVQVGIGARF
jgi:opacity protein-like surface antigen